MLLFGRDDPVFKRSVREVGAVPVRMAIETGRLSVRCPPSVCNANLRIEDLAHIWFCLRNELFQLGHFAHLFECKDLILLIPINGQSSRVVASIFQARETFVSSANRTAVEYCVVVRTIDKCVEDVFPVLFHQVRDVAKNSAE